MIKRKIGQEKYVVYQFHCAREQLQIHRKFIVGA